MDQHGYVTIVVDDGASMRILRAVAERCGGTVGFSSVARVALAVAPATSIPLPQPEGEARAAPLRLWWR